MKKLKLFVVGIILIDLILVFPVMLSYQSIGKFLQIKGIAEVFTTLTVEITLLVLTSLLAYIVSRMFKGTPFRKGLYLISWGVLMYGIGDTHLLVWMYTGIEGIPPFFGQAGSSIAHALGVGLGFILVITGLYKIASARNSVLPSGNGQN